MESHQSSRRWFMAVAMVVVVSFGASVQAAEPSLTAKNPKTTVTTKKMCPVCAKKIVAALLQMEGVANASPDVKSKAFIVVPVPGRVLSPRALWETVEKGGEQPIRLAGPNGTFDKKPRF